MRLILLFSLCCFVLKADVKSTKGVLHFDSNADNVPELTLTSSGLGGGTPSANLHVQGNMLVEDQISIGSSLTTSANFYLDGSMGFSTYTLATQSDAWQNYSMILVDTSSDNVSVNLPLASSFMGRTYQFKKISPSNNFLVVSGDNIDANRELFFSSNTSLASLEVISDGSTWRILSIKEEDNTFDPSQVSGLKAWYISDVGTWQDTAKTTLARSAGDAVALWEGQSGQGNDATVSANANRPILSSANQIFGRTTLVFDGSDDFFNVPDIRAGVGDQYAYIVSQRSDAIGLTWQRLIGSWDGASGDDYLGSGWVIIPSQSGGSPLAYSPTISTVTGTDHTMINIKLGKSGINNTQYLYGNIAEVLIFDVVPSASERSQIEDYLTSRWSL